jgi:hypothetical protein
MASIIYGSCVRDILTGDIDFDTHTFKALLVGSTYDAVSDETKKDSHAFRSDVTNEITGTGYTAGGNSCTATVGSLDTTNNRVEVTFSVTNWTSATITSAYGLVIYRNVGTAGTDRLVCYVAFSNAPAQMAHLAFHLQAISACRINPGWR